MKYVTPNVIYAQLWFLLSFSPLEYGKIGKPGGGGTDWGAGIRPPTSYTSSTFLHSDYTMSAPFSSEYSTSPAIPTYKPLVLGLGFLGLRVLGF